MFCGLIGCLFLKSTFFPPLLGVLMIFAGAYYLTNDSFVGFPGLPDIPLIGLLRPTLVAEVALALWLTIVGVDETKWRAQFTHCKTTVMPSVMDTSPKLSVLFRPNTRLELHAGASTRNGWRIVSPECSSSATGYAATPLPIVARSTWRLR